MLHNSPALTNRPYSYDSVASTELFSKNNTTQNFSQVTNIPLTAVTEASIPDSSNYGVQTKVPRISSKHQLMSSPSVSFIASKAGSFRPQSSSPRIKQPTPALPTEPSNIQNKHHTQAAQLALDGYSTSQQPMSTNITSSPYSVSVAASPKNDPKQNVATADNAVSVSTSLRNVSDPLLCTASPALMPDDASIHGVNVSDFPGGEIVMAPNVKANYETYATTRVQPQGPPSGTTMKRVLPPFKGSDDDVVSKPNAASNPLRSFPSRKFSFSSSFVTEEPGIIGSSAGMNSSLTASEVSGSCGSHGNLQVPREELTCHDMPNPLSFLPKQSVSVPTVDHAPCVPISPTHMESTVQGNFTSGIYSPRNRSEKAVDFSRPSSPPRTQYVSFSQTRESSPDPIFTKKNLSPSPDVRLNTVPTIQFLRENVSSSKLQGLSSELTAPSMYGSSQEEFSKVRRRSSLYAKIKDSRLHCFTIFSSKLDLDADTLRRISRLSLTDRSVISVAIKEDVVNHIRTLYTLDPKNILVQFLNYDPYIAVTYKIVKAEIDESVKNALIKRSDERVQPIKTKSSWELISG